MSNPRILKFIGSGTNGELAFDAGTDFAINPFSGENAFAAADFRNQVLTAVGTGTVIVYGSTQELPPDFSSASVLGNTYAPIVIADYSLVATYYAGATGMVVAGSTMIGEPNTNLLTWIGIHRSANTVDVLLTETNNQ